MTMGISPTRPTSHEPPQPDPEVLERPQRRRFTAEYRTSILRQADACTHKGELGALLRREGLYSSLLSDWRRRRKADGLAAPDRKRGRKPMPASEAELVRLRKENAKLTKELHATRMVVDVQKNVSALLGIALESAEPETTP
jgi:transposase-like protein